MYAYSRLCPRCKGHNAALSVCEANVHTTGTIVDYSNPCGIDEWRVDHGRTARQLMFLLPEMSDDKKDDQRAAVRSMHVVQLLGVVHSVLQNYKASKDSPFNGVFMMI